MKGKPFEPAGHQNLALGCPAVSRGRKQMGRMSSGIHRLMICNLHLLLCISTTIRLQVVHLLTPRGGVSHDIIPTGGDISHQPQPHTQYGA